MANEERFTGRVAEYKKYRMRYPASVVAVLRERCGLRPADLIADVGAGTGMLSELFLETGNRVIAIEPNAEMRQACEGLVARYPKLRIVNATAEATSLEEASVDLVTVGRAFHWFDRERTLAEFKRILKPGGWVVLVANRRDRESDDQAREYEGILIEHGTDYADVRGGYRSFEGLKPYGDCETFDLRTPGEEQLTLEQFLGQTQSLSVTPMPGDPKHEGMQRALREFFARWSVQGVLALKTNCEVVGWRAPLSTR